jgi:hypothetical protein
MHTRVLVKARLKEMQKLANAVARMTIGLSSFKKYVPARLVPQLIRANQEAKISGQRRAQRMQVPTYLPNPPFNCHQRQRIAAQ